MNCENLKVDRSLEIWKKAEEVIYLGVQTMSKSPRTHAFGAFPIYIERGQGAHLFDVDGNEYIDYVCSFGPIILGHGYPRVVEAVKKQLEKGTIFSLSNENEVILAQEMIDSIPCAEMVRFVKTGAEATTAAARIARAYTGREKILSCGYHGWNDWSAASSRNKERGIPKALEDLIYSFRFNDLESLRELLDREGPQVAAVFITPLAGREPTLEFLEGAKELAHKNGSLLVFDEIFTGFRLAMGGAQERYGVVPDIATFAKAMANGFPIAAVASRKDIFAKTPGVGISSTYAGEILSLVAGIETIRELREKDVQKHIGEYGERLKKGIQDIADSLGVPMQVVGAPHLPYPVFNVDKDIYEDVWTLYLQEMAKEGILVRRQMYMYITYSHTEADLAKTLDAVGEALSVVGKALEQGNVNKYLKTIEPSEPSYLSLSR
jgi:glutamate-1-semialdehyde 2,1-aminomutase